MLKVALVHDYLKEYGGAERVLEALAEIFPKAIVFVAYYNPTSLGKHKERFKSWDIRTSFLQKIPSQLLSPLKFLSPLAFEQFNLAEFDLVISSSAAYFAKAAITKPESLHLSYIHTPPRYLYGYTTAFDLNKNPLIKFGATFLNHFMRMVDYEVSQRPDILIANSKNVASRIKKFYRRDSVVIYPPVDIKRLTINDLRLTKKKYFLVHGRLDKHKRVDLIIKTFNKLNLPLKISGGGAELEFLKKIAGKNVEFLGEVEESKLPQVYASAKAVIVSTEDEDFGIVPVEAFASGTPVIAIREGGFLETIIEGKTGEFFPRKDIPKSEWTEELLIDSLSKLVEHFDPKKYAEDELRKHAGKFSKERFKKEILELVSTHFASRTKEF